MTGQEIADTFGNREVLEMEAKLNEIERQLKETHEQLAITEDPEELEELRERSANIRESNKVLLADIRKAKEKFSSSTGFKKTG